MAGDFVVESCVSADSVDAKVKGLVQDLGSDSIGLQRNAAQQLRSLTKRSKCNRDSIADAGAIPSLVHLLSIADPQLQVDSVTTLLNMSINHTLKESILKANAINPIIEVLKKGIAEARENAAAALFSLASSPASKAKIGFSGAFPALVDLLEDGSYRGKRDAASCIFSLAVLPGNRALAVRAGVVGPLMKLILDDSSKLQDEALATLAIIASHQEGQSAVTRANAVPMLVELIATGHSRNKENAAGILLDVGKSDRTQVVAAVRLGVYGPLGELASTGSEKGRRRAVRLMQLINSYRMDVDDVATSGGDGSATKFSSI